MSIILSERKKKWECVWTIMTEISNFFHIYDLWSWQQGKNSPLPHSCCISDIHLKTPQFLTILCKIYIYIMTWRLYTIFNGYFHRGNLLRCFMSHLCYFTETQYRLGLQYYHLQSLIFHLWTIEGERIFSLK